MPFHRFVLTLLVCAASLLGAPAREAAVSSAQTRLAQLPLHFEANQGQWSSEVRYAARSGQGTVFLTAAGPVLANSTHRIDIQLLHASRTPRLEALDRQRARTDYFLGAKENWHTGVAQYQRVAYRSVYPGIDVIYYGSQNQLEYDFVLQPGADPRSIRLRFRGASRLRLTPEGDLLVESGDAHFVHKRPVIYQTDANTGARRAVAGEYQMLARGVAGVRVGPYDKTQPLVVDPVLEYSSFLGGAVTDAITAVKSDPQGHICVVGYTYNSDLPYSPGSLQTFNVGQIDTFAAIFDITVTGPDSLIYLTYLGGARDDSPTDLAVDSSGNLYITGTTTSSDFPLAGNSVQTALVLSTTSAVFLPDVFVAEIIPNSALQYGTYFGGTGDDTPHGIALDANGNVYVIGTTTSTDLAATSTAYAAVLYGSNDAFLLKLDLTSTTPAYATYLGGIGREDGRGIAVSPSGLVYFAASTFSPDFPLAGSAYQGSLLGFENIIIGVMDMTKSNIDSLVYATYFGGSTIDEVRKIVLDANGRLLVTGWTLSTDFPVTPAAFQSSAPGSGDAFVTRLNVLGPAAGFVEYSTYLGGGDGDVAYDIATDASGTIYVAGYTLSDDFPTVGAVQSLFGLGIEAFVVKLNPKLAGREALLFGSYFGTTGVHVATGLGLAPDGSIFIGGYTTSSIQTTDSAFQPGFGGGYTDGFVIAVK